MDVAPTQTFSIEDLREPPYNFNVMSESESAGLEQSIGKFGVVEYPVVNTKGDRRGIIVGGSHRVRSARAAGATELPCIVVDLDLDDERELHMRLNKHRGQPQAELIREFFGDKIEDLTNVGYTADDFRAWELMAEDAASDLEAAAATAADDDSPHVSNQLQHPGGAPVFHPATNPQISDQQVTDSDVDKAAGKLEHKFQGGGRPQNEFDVICPHCQGEFTFSA